MRIILASVLAAVAMFFWGFLYWAANEQPYAALKSPADSAAAAAALQEHFPEPGTWMVPSMVLTESYTQDDMEKLHAAGPNAIVHLKPGSTGMGPTLLQGFLGMLATAFCLAVLLNKVAPQFPKYADRVRFAGSIGVVGAVLIDVGDAVWWHQAWGWQLYQIFYHISVCLVAGLVLAYFIAPRETDA